MSKQRVILLVDDSEDDLMLLREGFVRANCQHAQREARNGEEAVAYLTGEGPCADRTKYPLPTVMLLDLNMPKMNGFEVLTWVRAQTNFKYLAVFILTASMRNEDVENAYYLGATGFLVKPTTLDALAAMMRCLCEWVELNHFPPQRPVP